MNIYYKSVEIAIKEIRQRSIDDIRNNLIKTGWTGDALESETIINAVNDLDIVEEKKVYLDQINKKIDDLQSLKVSVRLDIKTREEKMQD